MTDTAYNDLLDKLHYLWDNHELFIFLGGEEYLTQREIEICEASNIPEAYVYLAMMKLSYANNPNKSQPV